jgi:hypothetical protein
MRKHDAPTSNSFCFHIKNNLIVLLPKSSILEDAGDLPSSNHNILSMFENRTMSKDFRFNKKDYGFDDEPAYATSSNKQQKGKKASNLPKPKSSFERFDKRA